MFSQRRSWSRSRLCHSCVARGSIHHHSHAKARHETTHAHAHATHPTHAAHGVHHVLVRILGHCMLLCICVRITQCLQRVSEKVGGSNTSWLPPTKLYFASVCVFAVFLEVMQNRNLFDQIKSLRFAFVIQGHSLGISPKAQSKYLSHRDGPLLGDIVHFWGPVYNLLTNINQS